MENTRKRMGLQTKELILIALFTALTTIGAFIKIPFPLVPFSLQNLFTTLSGLLLGSHLGALAVGLYVVLGLMGLPVFTSGGGISYVFKPTFGYLLGFILGAWVTGKIKELRGDHSFSTILISSAAGMICIYIVGVTYYYLMATFLMGQEVGAEFLLVNFVLMTIPGDIIKCIVITLLGKKLLPVLNNI